MRILTILLKDLSIRFRDRRALLYLLAAPLLLGFIMGAAFSGQNDGSSPLSAIPLAVANADRGDLGAAFTDALQAITVPTADGEQPLFDLLPAADPDAARALVEQGQARGALLIPADFSAALTSGQPAEIRLLTDPAASVSPLIIESVVRRLAASFAAPALGSRLSGDLIAGAIALEPERAAQLRAAAPGVIAELAADRPAAPSLGLERHTLGASAGFDIMAYMMPAMAVFFLMFAMFAGTRAILSEQSGGTLARLLTAGVSPAEVLAGKIGAALATGLLQMAVLALVSGLLFGVDWGAPSAVAILTLATVTAAGGVGALVAALARDENQAGVLGTLLSLVFGVLGGNFISLQGVPAWLDLLSKATLNRWALDGYLTLALERGGLADILPNLGVLTLIAAASFGLALPLINRRLARGLA